ncbi:restriction endonuclease subunit S [Microbulbifer sp. ANSA003]|uniref:restriction endonuclease subunit S n=1 Tax=Microbulbifer sp. ANSA003 TaxID=3243360 RepID=UPI004042AEC0
MNWPLVSIGEHVEKVNSWSPAKNLDADAFDYIDLSSVDKDLKQVCRSEVSNILPGEAPSRARQLVNEGDVLVATVRPNLNGVALVPEDLSGATASTGYCVLRARDSSLDCRYLFYWVQTKQFVKNMMSKATGANYPAVSDKIIKESQIPLPPLKEQKRIAAILDKADNLRRKRQQAIQLADEFLRSVFLDMFGDPVTNPKGFEVKSLQDLLFFQEGPGVRKWQFRESGVKLLNVKNIVNGELVLENSDKYLSEEEVSTKYSHFLAEEGDLVMASSGATWGKVAWVKKADLPLCMNTSTIRFRPINNADINREFMRGYLESVAFTKQVDRLITGSAQPNFGPSHLKQVELYLPPMELQRKYSMIEKLVKKVVSDLKASNPQELFLSLNKQAFSGRL